MPLRVNSSNVLKGLKIQDLVPTSAQNIFMWPFFLVEWITAGSLINTPALLGDETLTDERNKQEELRVDKHSGKLSWIYDWKDEVT